MAKSDRKFWTAARMRACARFVVPVGAQVSVPVLTLEVTSDAVDARPRTYPKGGTGRRTRVSTAVIEVMAMRRTEESKINVLSSGSGSEEANQKLGIGRQSEAGGGAGSGHREETTRRGGTHGSVGEVMFWCPLAVIGG